MKKLCVISMLILGIAGNTFCQKNKTKYDTLSYFVGIKPPILLNDFPETKNISVRENKSKNANHIVIDFGNKNSLLVDYQGVKEFKLKQNVDSLLRDFWKNYSLLHDTISQNHVKKITYFAKYKNINRKAIIDVQYFPQKEVFQFGKEVELVRLKQDTLLLIGYNENTETSGTDSFKFYGTQSFLFNLNSIDDIEDILETNINQAIIEASERVKNERKDTYPWKSVNVENDLASQRIRSKTKGTSLFNFVNIRGDIGVGAIKGQFQGSATFALELSSTYLKKGFITGSQKIFTFAQNGKPFTRVLPTYFLGMTFYQRKNDEFQLKSGLFIGFNETYKYSSSPNVVITEKSTIFKLFSWYQLTPQIRIQIEFVNIERKRFNPDFAIFPPVTKETSIDFSPSFRLSFGF